MSFEGRSSSRRTSKRPRTFGAEEMPSASLIPFPSGRRSFFSELVKFHSDRGTPLPRFPTISGRFVDLFELYCAVINRGGFNRSTSFDSWADIADALGLGKSTNLTVGLRQIYARYLAHYESVTISLDDEDMHDFDDLHGETSSSFPRRKTIPTITVCNIPVQMSYLYDTSRQSRSVGVRQSTLASRDSNYLDKIFLALLSGLPNEQQFLLDTCMLLSTDPSHAFAICDHDYILSLFLAHLAVLPDNSSLTSLYSEWFRKTTPHSDFSKFWMESVTLPCVQNYMLTLDFFQRVIFECSSLTSNPPCSSLSKFDSNSPEHKHVTLILYLIRHLSFESRNQQKLAGSSSVQQFLLFCIGNKFANLRVLALDTVANIAPALILSQDCLSQIITEIVVGLLNSPDSVDRIRCMEILTGLCQKQSSVRVVLERMDLKVYERIVEMLTVQDLLVLLSCVGLLYQLTYLGSDICDSLVQVKYVVELLTALVTFDVQSMGLEALTSVKVIDQPKSMFARAQSSSQQNGMSLNESQGVELERLAVKWLLAQFELTAEESAGVFSNDIFPVFKKYCSNSTLRHAANDFAQNQFNRCLKIAFPTSHAKLISSFDNSMFFPGIRKKTLGNSYERPHKNVFPLNGMTPFPTQPKNHSHSQKSNIDHNSVVNLNKVVAIKPRPGPVLNKSESTVGPAQHAESPKTNRIKSEAINSSVQPSQPSQAISSASNIKPKPEAPAISIAAQTVKTVTSCASQVTFPLQIRDSSALTSALPGGSQNQQQPILVQVMLTGANEAVFKKQTAVEPHVIANNVSATQVITTDHNSAKSNSLARKPAPAIFLSSGESNRLFLSPVANKAPTQAQQVPQGKPMRPIQPADCSSVANIVPANNHQSMAPPLLVSNEQRSIPTVVHHPNNANITSAQPAAATVVCAKPVSMSQQHSNVVLTGPNQPGLQVMSDKIPHVNSANMVPNMVSKPKPAGNSVAPPIITSSAQAKQMEQSLLSNAYVNGNCGSVVSKMNGEVNDAAVTVALNGGLANQGSNRMANVPALNINNNNPSSNSPQMAYQNGVANGNPVSNSSIPGRCEVNGVVYKIVNDFPSVTNTSNAADMPRKVVLAHNGDDNQYVNQGQIVVNGDASSHDLDLMQGDQKARVLNQHVGSFCVPPAGVFNGDVSLTAVPVNRKRKNSPDVFESLGSNQVLIASSNVGDEPTLSVFRKIKVTEASMVSSYVPSNPNSSSTAAAQGNSNAASSSKKDSTPFSCIPSLHAAVNSVLAASADGSLTTGASPQGTGSPSVASKSSLHPVDVSGITSQPLISQKQNPPSNNPVPAVRQFVPAIVEQNPSQDLQRSDENSYPNMNPDMSEPGQGQGNSLPQELGQESTMDCDNSELTFQCEWYNCSSRFEKWQEVFHHCCRVHCADIGCEGAICQWNSCDGLRRKRLSLFTHLQEKHCTESLLKGALSRNNSNRPPIKPTAPSAHAESLYNTHTLHHALQRSGFVAPSKDPTLSVFEKEGPVSKSVRLNAALVLRNLAQHSSQGRELIKTQERKLSLAASSCIEASPFLANCLLNLCNLETN